MNKILVGVYVPILNKTYEMFIPSQVCLYEIVDAIKKVIFEIEFEQYIIDGNMVVCYKNTGEVLDINLSIEKLNICNGTQLALI